MAYNIGAASIAIGANTFGLQTGLAQATGHVNKFASAIKSGNLKQAVDGIKQLFQGLGQSIKAALSAATASISDVLGPILSIIGGILAALTGIAIGEKFWETAAAIKEAQKEAQAFGISLQWLQGLQGTGIDTQAMGGGMRHMSQQIEQAREGSATAVRNLRMVGVEFQQIAHMGTEEQFNHILQHISAMPAGAQRTAAATAILGRNAMQMRELFNGGAEGINRARQHAEDLGLVLSHGQEDNVTKMNSAWKEVSLSIKGIWTQITANLAPIMTTIGNIMTKIWAVVKAIVVPITAIIGAGWEVMSTILSAIWGVFEAIANTIGKVLMPIVNVFKNAFVGAIRFIVDFGIRPLIRAVAAVARWIPGLGSIAQGAQHLDEMLSRLTSDTNAANNAAQNLAQQTAAANTALHADLEGIADKLRTVHRQFGMNQEEKEIDNLVERMRRLGYEIDATNQALIRQVQAAADQNLGQQMAQQIDPTIQLQREMTRLQRVYQNGGLSAEHFAMQQQRLLQSAERTLGLSKEMKIEHAVEAGSKQAYEILAKFSMGEQHGESVQERMLGIQEAQRQIQQLTLEQLRRNAPNPNGPVAPMLY